MNLIESSFLKAVMGHDGAEAFQRAVKKSSALESALMPRSITSWLGYAARVGYEGEVPGVADSYLELQKSGQDRYDGYITIGDYSHEFNSASILQVAASMAVAMGTDLSGIDMSVKSTDMARLGKNIDMLVCGQFIDLLKSRIEESSETLEESESSVDKQEAPGQAAAPRPPGAPTMAVQPVKQPRQQKPKVPSMKITKAQAKRACEVCGDPQFQNDRFAGCACLKDLAKSTTTKLVANGYVIKFGDDWTQNDISVLCDMIGE